MKNRVRVLRTEQNWSQEQLANELGVSRQTVHAIEAEKYDPSLSLAFKIGRFFCKRLEEIFLTCWSGEEGLGQRAEISGGACGASRRRCCGHYGRNRRGPRIARGSCACAACCRDGCRFRPFRRIARR